MSNGAMHGGEYTESKRLCHKASHFARHNKVYLLKVWFCLAVTGKVAFVMWVLCMAAGMFTDSSAQNGIDCKEFERQNADIKLRFSVLQKNVNARKSNAPAPIYFFAAFTASKEVVADLTRTVQALENVKTAHVHVFLVEIVDRAEIKKKSRDE
jgi:hypothetical protein